MHFVSNDPTFTATAEYKLIVPHLKFHTMYPSCGSTRAWEPAFPNTATYFFPEFVFLSSGCSWLVFVGCVCFRCCNCYSYIAGFNFSIPLLLSRHRRHAWFLVCATGVEHGTNFPQILWTHTTAHSTWSMCLHDGWSASGVCVPCTFHAVLS